MINVQEWAEEAGLDIHVRLWAFSEGEDKCYCAECEQARELYETWLREQPDSNTTGQPESHLSVALRVVPELEKAQAKIEELESEMEAESSAVAVAAKGGSEVSCEDCGIETDAGLCRVCWNLEQFSDYELEDQIDPYEEYEGDVT